MICAKGPIEVGCSKSAAKSRTQKGSTGTLSRIVVPDPVTRWPKPVQSSTTVMPGVSRGTKASVLRPSSSLATTAIQCANSTPVE